MKVTIIPIVIGAFGTVTKELLKGLEDLEVDGPNEDHPNDSITKNGQNTEKSPGDLRRLAVTQTSVKYHQLKLMGKTLKEKNNKCIRTYIPEMTRIGYMCQERKEEALKMVLIHWYDDLKTS